MEWAAVIGALALGALLGWMGHDVFVGRRDMKTLTGFVTVIAGTVVLGLFRSFSGSGPEATLPLEVWFYPVGLLAGFGLAAVIKSRVEAENRREKQRLEAENRREKERLEAENRREKERLEAEQLIEKQLLQAKEIILHILRTRLTKAGKHITMISFEELEKLNPKLKPDLVRAVISRSGGELCLRTLAPDTPGGPRRAGVGLP